MYTVHNITQTIINFAVKEQRIFKQQIVYSIHNRKFFNASLFRETEPKKAAAKTEEKQNKRAATCLNYCLLLYI